MNSDKKKMHHLRSLGVAKAWKRERRLVRQGRATRIWAIREQKEMLDYGRVRGYQGHHLKSVAKYPQYAAEPDNIQILRGWVNDNEHLRAHGGDYRNDTESVYSISTGRLMRLPAGKPRLTGSYELPHKAIERYGYTHYALNNAADKPRKAQAQVNYGGKTYNRDMVHTAGKSGGSSAAKGTGGVTKNAGNVSKSANNTSKRTGNTSVSANNAPKSTGNAPKSANNVAKRTGNTPKNTGTAKHTSSTRRK